MVSPHNEAAIPAEASSKKQRRGKYIDEPARSTSPLVIALPPCPLGRRRRQKDKKPVSFSSSSFFPAAANPQTLKRRTRLPSQASGSYIASEAGVGGGAKKRGKPPSSECQRERATAW